MIVEVLRHYGAAVPDRAGRFSVRCPFHDDTVRSGLVDRPRDTFTCFACGVRGTSRSVVQQREGLDTDAAQRFVEGIAGKGNEAVQRLPKRNGTYVPFQSRDQRGNGTKGAARRRRFPFAWT